MSTHPLPELLHLWETNKLTNEQATGHVMQHLAALTKRIHELEARVRQLEQAAAARPPA